YKFNEDICVYCNKIINYCKEYYKLIFCYHYKYRYVEFFKINICCEECSNEFIVWNSNDENLYKYDIVWKIVENNKDKIYCIRTKYKYCPDKSVKHCKGYKYKYNDYVFSLSRIEKVVIKFLQNQLK